MVQKFELTPLDLQGAYLISPFVATDERGGFVKDYSAELFAQHDMPYDLKEVFYTISHKGVIRAMHFQRVKQQAKLVRCISGKVFDVIVDLRKESDTFLQWRGFYLSGDNFQQLLVPEGFGHGYLVLEDSVVHISAPRNSMASMTMESSGMTKRWASSGRSMSLGRP